MLAERKIYTSSTKKEILDQRERRDWENYMVNLYSKTDSIIRKNYHISAYLFCEIEFNFSWNRLFEIFSKLLSTRKLNFGKMNTNMRIFMVCRFRDQNKTIETHSYTVCIFLTYRR